MVSSGENTASAGTPGIGSRHPIYRSVKDIMYKYELATVFFTIPETLTPDTFNLNGRDCPIFVYSKERNQRQKHQKHNYKGDRV